MDIKIIVATHKQYRMPSDNCYMPLHVGKQGKVDLGYLGDDSGDSISEKNGHYCELTGLYWAWKNLKSDYIGLVHYRRYLANRWRKLMFWKGDPFYAVLTKNEIEKLLKKTDIILPAKRHYFIESLYSHYSHTHYEEHLIITRNILEQSLIARGLHISDFIHYTQVENMHTIIAITKIVISNLEFQNQE